MRSGDLEEVIRRQCQFPVSNSDSKIKVLITPIPRSRVFIREVIGIWTRCGVWERHPGATAFTHSLSWPSTRPPRRHAMAVQEALGRLRGRRRLGFLAPRAAATASSVRGRYGRRRHQRPQQRARGRRRCREEGDGSGARRAGSAENSPHYPGSCVRHTRVHPCCGDSGRLSSI